MDSGWQYRLAGLAGTVGCTALAVTLAYQPLIQSVVRLVPLVGGLPMESATGTELAFEVVTTATVVLLGFIPLFKPQPRRILDTWTLGVERTALAVLALATIGYFDYTYRLPRSTLVVVGTILVMCLPLYFVGIRRQPATSGGRTVVVGDSPAQIAEILADVDGDVVGYVAPAESAPEPRMEAGKVRAGYTDGGRVGTLGDLSRLGGLSRFEEILIDEDVDTAVLAFARPDRSEFFGTLSTCYEYCVTAKVHRNHADAVLTQDLRSGPLVAIDLEPWDPQDQLLKRLFDVAFASAGLLLLTPAIVAIAAAIKHEDGGPVLYRQERTAAFGDTFSVVKFRSMVPDAERASGATLSIGDTGSRDPRVTRVGRVLRTTHLDEIPQLWSVLVGDMSVVGPRPERPELDADIESTVTEWRSRWFVKPGLTGLAQINGVTGHDPQAKLRYDMEYIRRQSLPFDAKIVIRQLYQVVTDGFGVVTAS